MNSEHGSCARRSKPARPKPTRRISSRSFNRTLSPRVGFKPVHFVGSTVAKIIKAMIFRLKKHKSSRNSFVINKSIQNPCRFFSIFLRFYARNGPFLPQNPPQRAPSFRLHAGAWVPAFPPFARVPGSGSLGSHCSWPSALRSLRMTATMGHSFFERSRLGLQVSFG